MAGVLVLLALMLIFSTVIFQNWEDVIRRDNEAEMIFRAQEYSRAILRYKKSNATPPVKLEQLLEPGPKAQYFLRRLYTDPLVKDGKWGLLYIGPNQEILDPNAAQIGENAGQRGNVDQERVDEVLRQMAGGTNIHSLAQGELGQSALESEVAGGRMFPGMQIAGVKTLCRDEPFRIYNGFEDYQDWLFTFLDLTRPQVPGGNKNQPGGPNLGNQGGPRGQQSPRLGGAPNAPRRRGGNNR